MKKNCHNKWLEYLSTLTIPANANFTPIFVLNLIRNTFEAGYNSSKLENSKQFPNGFQSWQETHFEVVGGIIEDLERYPGGVANKIVEEFGIGKLYEFSEEWADEFEKLNKDRFWDGEFVEEITEFVENKLKKVMDEYK